MDKAAVVFEWEWDDKLGNRSRKPACLVIAPNGAVHRFTGENIEGVVKVLNPRYHKNGKWSYTNYPCVSPRGTQIHAWKQDWDTGHYWPQASWEEAFETVQQSAPHVNLESLEAIIRKDWPKAAEKFDENRSVTQAFAQPAPAATVKSVVVSVELLQRLMDSSNDINAVVEAEFLLALKS